GREGRRTRRIGRAALPVDEPRAPRAQVVGEPRQPTGHPDLEVHDVELHGASSQPAAHDPPNPALQESAWRTRTGRAEVTRSSASAGRCNPALGGRTPRSSATAVITASRAPAAPSVCPVAPLVLDTAAPGSRRASSAPSIASFGTVPV